MTQIWPGLGTAPVPALVSMIVRPDCVVNGLSRSCAVTALGAPAATRTAKYASARANTRRPAGGFRIFLLLARLRETASTPLRCSTLSKLSDGPARLLDRSAGTPHPVVCQGDEWEARHAANGCGGGF